MVKVSYDSYSYLFLKKISCKNVNLSKLPSSPNIITLKNSSPLKSKCEHELSNISSSNEFVLKCNNKRRKKPINDVKFNFDSTVDFSLQLKSSPNKILFNPENNHDNKITQLANKNISAYLQKFNNEGVLDLSFADLTFEPILKHSIALKKCNNSGIKYIFLYSVRNLDVIIAIPINNNLKNLRFKLVNLLKNKINNFQVGKRKYKLIILTPRKEASWLQRKINNSAPELIGDYEYVTVKVKKTFAKLVKDCINQIL